MSQLAFRSIFILLQAVVGVFVLRNEISQRQASGRGGFRVPHKKRPAVFAVDMFFWLSVLGWVAAGVSWFFFPATRAMSLPMRALPLEILQWAGLVVGSMAACLIIGGIVSLGSSFRTSIDYDETPALVSGGIYKYIRNPMALGLLLHGWAGFLLHQSWVAFIAAFVLHATNRLRVHFEEGYLRETLGEPYEEFCRRVGRFFPRAKRASTTENTEDSEKNKTK